MQIEVHADRCASCAKLIFELAHVVIPSATARVWLATAPRSGEEILALWRAVVRYIAEDHRSGKVHGGLTPDQVLVCERDQIKLVAARDPHLAPAYLAPELLRRAPPTSRSDQFALCVSIWEALAGKRPFSGATVGALAVAMMSPLSPPAGVDRSVVAALVRGLAPDPLNRWPDLEALLARLDTRPVRYRRFALVVVFAVIAIVVIMVVPVTPVVPAIAVEAEIPAANLEACPTGQVRGDDTRGHCCWPTQVWSPAKNRCVGKPVCPKAFEARGEICEEIVVEAPIDPSLPTPPALQKFTVGGRSLQPGDKAVVRFVQPLRPLKGERFWIAVTHAAAPDSTWGTWVYVPDGATTIQLVVPDAPGAYEVRLHANYPTKASNVVHRVAITVSLVSLNAGPTEPE